jgi:hypothetical protein
MRVVAFSLFLLLSAVCAPAMAQTDTLEEKQKAVVVFDIRMDSIRSSELAKKLKLTEKLSEMRTQSGDDGPDPSTMDRIFGAMSAPENMESAMAIQMGEMPFDFFVKVSFNDEASVNDLVAKATEKEFETVDHDGESFFKMPEEGGPAGVLMHKVDAKTIELGTEGYLFRPDRNLLTDNLKAADQNSPNAAVRLALDVAGAKGLVDEMVAMGQQQAPPPFGEFIGLIDNIQDISFILDVSGNDLLKVTATGVNQEDAVELKEGLDSLLGLAKNGIKTMLPMIRQQDPDGAAVMERLSETLNATNENETVSITIPTPEGFEDWVVQQVENLPIFGG